MNKEMMMNKKYGIEYTIIRKNVKNVNMRIQDGGKIVISANEYVPLHVIENFVDDKISWILEKQKEQINKQESRNLSENEVFFFGKKIQFQYKESPYERIQMYEDTLVVSARDEERAKRIAQRELDKQLEIYIEEKVAYYMEQLRDYRLPYPEVRYRRMSRRWGSCEPSRSRLTFNRNLMMAPKEFIDYVVLHEIVHMVQPNHSKAFYGVIAYYMPDYKQRIALMS